MKRRTADTDGTDDIEAAFKVFDTNNDGQHIIDRRAETCCQYTAFLSSFIDTEELMGVMVMMGNPRTEEEVQIMISEEDKNGDGLIDREEFFAMLQKGK